MPSISFSPANMIVTTYSTSEGSLGRFLFNNNLSNTLVVNSLRYLNFRIYKGTEPSTFTNLNSKSFYDSDLLFKVSYAQQTDPVVSTVIENQTYKVSYQQDIAVTATGSGTATWFWAYFDGSYSDSGSDSVPGFMFRGTCGAVGSGADMELDYPTIVSGSEYLVTNLCSFTINLEYTWT